MCINNQICYVNRCDRSCAARNPVQSTVLTPASVVDDNDPRIAHQLSTIHTSHLIATSEATKNLQQSWPARRILESRSSLTAWPSLPYNFLAKKHACICKTALRWEPPAAFQASSRKKCSAICRKLWQWSFSFCIQGAHRNSHPGSDTTWLDVLTQPWDWKKLWYD